MHISNDGYFLDRERHDLALRMIRHEARTCTIRSCTGLTDDRIRKLYKTYASHTLSKPIRRRRGKSPRQPSYFVRNVRAQYESSLLASTFASFGLLAARSRVEPASICLGRLFCDAYETHQQLLRSSGVCAGISFEHAWFLLHLLGFRAGLRMARCRRCDSQYLRDPVHAARRACPACALKNRAKTRVRGPRCAASGAQAVTYEPVRMCSLANSSQTAQARDGSDSSGPSFADRLPESPSMRCTESDDSDAPVRRVQNRVG